VLNRSVVNEVIAVATRDAKWATCTLALKEGIFAGISSGAALRAALTVAGREENRGKLIVVILPDTGERYLTTDTFSSTPRSLGEAGAAAANHAPERAATR
jgi:cysteine synthase A